MRNCSRGNHEIRWIEGDPPTQVLAANLARNFRGGQIEGQYRYKVNEFIDFPGDNVGSSCL